MKRFLISSSLAACLIVVAPVGIVLASAGAEVLERSLQTVTLDNGGSWAPGEVLVKFKMFAPAREDISGRFSIDSLPAAAKAVLGDIQGELLKSYPGAGIARIQLPSNDDETLRHALVALRRSGSVVYAQPNYKNYLDRFPNDPKFSNQWALHNTGTDADVDAPEAWQIRTNGNKTIAVVIDTGVQYAHEDLQESMWTNPNEVPGDGIDNDGNGYIDDVHGINTFKYSLGPTDLLGHGTQVSGVIGARGNNGKGVAGMAWNSRILACNAWDPWTGVALDSDLVECMEYVLDIKEANGYTRMVVNASWGSTEWSQAIYDGIKMLGQAGVLFIASAGNQTWNSDFFPHYPSGYDLENIISVGGSNARDEIDILYSNYGAKTVDLFAPGTEILSTNPYEGYLSQSGTSLAAPHVTGACALLWSRRPTASWKQIKGMILNGAEPGVTNGFANKALVEGRLNLWKSIQLTGAEPSVLSFNPNPAWIGNEVTIEGTGFGSSAGVLEFQGKPVSPAAIQRWDQERVIFKILPDMGYGYGSLELKTAGAKSAKACLGILRAPQVVGRMQQGHYFSCSARVGDNVWIFSGLNDMGPTKMVERYNLKTNESLIDPQWDIPQAVVGAGAAAIGKKIYVVGGSNQGKTEFYNLLQIFDTTSGRWSQGKPLPRPLRGANVIAHQGKIYVFGGSEKGYPYVLKTTFVYNPAMDAWSEKANLPVATTFAAGALAGSGKVWIMGGLWTDVGAFNNLEHDTVQVYDITTNTWRLFPSLLKPRGGAVGIYFQGNVHCLHGSAPIPDIARYDGEVFRDGAWHNAFMSGLRLYGLMGAVLGNKVFLFGGKSAFTDGPNRDVWSFSGS